MSGEGASAIPGTIARVVAPPSAARAIPAVDLPARLAGGAPPVVVLAGAERWFREDGLDRIVAAVLPGGDPGASFVRLDARRPEDREGVSAAVDDLRSPALFGGGKVIAIDAPESAGGPWAREARTSPLVLLAREALRAPVVGSTLVLLTAKPVKGKEAVPTKTLLETGAWVVDCRALYDAPGPWQRASAPHDHELARYLVRRMAEVHGKRLALVEAHALSRLVGSDLAGLGGALLTLALNAGERSTIAAEDLAALGATRTDPAWDLVDAVFSGEVDPALERLEQARARGLADTRLGTGVRGDEALLAVLGAALHGQFRKLLAAAEGLADGRPAEEVVRELGIPPFQQEPFLARVPRDRAGWLACHGVFLQAELAVKSGRSPAGVALTRLVIDLATAARRGRGTRGG